MEGFFADITSPERLKEELKSRASKLGWLSEEDVENLPGPVAYEYSSLWHFMIVEGNIEASCWKLTNLVEVVISHMFSAAIEESGNYENDIPTSPNEKINIIKETFPDLEMANFMDSLREILFWRNRYGIGHGTLLRSKQEHVDDLIENAELFFDKWPHYSSFARNYPLQERHGYYIRGKDYFEMIPRNDWNYQFSCTGKLDNKFEFAPVKVFGYQFDVPDIYFLTAKLGPAQNPSIIYRNYRNNRTKSLMINGQINWEDELEQVALLNKEEKEQWADFCRENIEPKLFLNKLIEAAEKYQRLGMYTEVKWCLEEIDELSNSTRMPLMLEKRKAVLGYSLNSALGNNSEAQQCLSLAKEQLSGETDELVIELKAHLYSEESWFKAKQLDVAGVDEVVKEGIAEVYEHMDKLPHKLKIKELEIRKNRLYAFRKTNDVDEVSRFREECLERLEVAKECYLDDPENSTIVDLIGFFCNLYTAYSLTYLMNTPDLSADERKEEEGKIFELSDAGLSIREKAYNSNPTDIWAVRGYAWSKHVKARLLWELQKNEEEALDLLIEARDLRTKEKARGDMGLYEDLVKNHIDIFKVKGSPQEEANEILKKITNNYEAIYNQEGFTPRVSDLRNRINKTFDFGKG